MTVYGRTFRNQEGALLRALAKASCVPMQIVQRAKMVSRSADNAKPSAIAKQIGVSTSRVREGITRFNTEGFLGLFDLPHSGRPRESDGQQALRVVKVATTLSADLGLPIKHRHTRLSRRERTALPVAWPGRSRPLTMGRKP